MKLCALLIVASAEARKLNEPPKQMERLKDHIDFVWNTWYAPSCKEARKARFDRFQMLVDRMQAQYEVCGYFNRDVPNGGPPVDYRKRRETEGEDGDCIFTPEGCPGNGLGRIDQTDMAKANKQLGRIVGRIAERYLSKCTKGLTADKLKAKGAKWTEKLNNMKCIGGPGND